MAWGELLFHVIYRFLTYLLITEEKCTLRSASTYNSSCNLLLPSNVEKRFDVQGLYDEHAKLFRNVKNLPNCNFAVLFITLVNLSFSLSQAQFLCLAREYHLYYRVVTKMLLLGSQSKPGTSLE